MRNDTQQISYVNRVAQEALIGSVVVPSQAQSIPSELFQHWDQHIDYKKPIFKHVDMTKVVDSDESDRENVIVEEHVPSSSAANNQALSLEDIYK
mgnify:CR=1